jgi:3-deoxy-7-phosphoheptulonate synthase
VGARQQPQWDDPGPVRLVREILASCPPLVSADDVLALRARLARVAAGGALLLQAGDCAEDPAECTPAHIGRKAALIAMLADTLGQDGQREVVRVGRIAGQFAKPRSRSVERVGGLDLPVYRGHMVNSPAPDAQSRRPDPLRILSCYQSARETMIALGWSGQAARAVLGGPPPVWTSHEALLLDYEIPMIAQLPGGRRWLSSTHFPWIGDRTRHPDGAHVDLLAGVLNPVAVKIGPTTTPAEVTALCGRLDPGREPGRLTLIARMGADAVTDLLPELAQAVRAADHPVIWVSDPMHANTITTASGSKTRLLTAIAREVRGFRQAISAAGAVAGGLHLETTPDDVTECIPDRSALASVADQHASFCDPRLNPGQAAALAAVWSDANDL